MQWCLVFGLWTQNGRVEGMWTWTGTRKQRNWILSPKWKKSLLLTFGYHYLKIYITGLCVGCRWPEATHFTGVSALSLSCEWRLGLQRHDFKEPEPNCSELVLGANSENCLLPIPTPAPSTFPQCQVFEAHQNWVCIGCHQSHHHCMKQIQDTWKVVGFMSCL